MSGLVERFRPVFDEIGAGAVEREAERRLPFAEVRLLRAAGFPLVTLPRELGGDAATHEELFELLAELARRDPNLAQAFRSHFSFIDRALHATDRATARRHLQRLAGGRIHGNATFERGEAKVGAYATRVTRDDAGLRLDGRKYYSTGTLFADLVSVAAEHGGDQVGVLVRTDAPGVRLVDDWNGFGQRMTGSGTTVFEGVRVDEHDLIGHDDRRPTHAGAFVQLVLLAVLAGIGRAVVDDAVAYVRARTRSYSHASGATARDDPLVQAVVGRLAASSFAADAAVAAAAAAIGRSSRAIRAADASADGCDVGAAVATGPGGLDADAVGDTGAGIAASVADADAATTRAQLVVVPAVLDATTRLFEVGGASLLDADRALDRHWRNARTVASHNPLEYKARALGDHLVNGVPLVAWWTSGEA